MLLRLSVVELIVAHQKKNFTRFHFFLSGLSAVFRTALTVIELLEPRLMDLGDEGAVLPLLLRVPVDV